MNRKLFSKNFTLVVIGQIISLFGNAVIRFALPLYLLNQTGSSAVYGTVTACALIPSILLSPVGGIVADRVNKRNIMVILDFVTAGIILVLLLLMDTADLVILLTVTLMILYGIAGAYQPSVQAGIPVLVDRDHIITANSIVNTINSLASLAGPVLGGVLYSAYGLKPVLWVCMACFAISAVMEIFIEMPFQRRASKGSMWETVKADFSESIRFIRKDRPVIGKALLTVCGINLFLSAMVTVAMPYLVTEVFDMGAVQANRLYGLAEGIMAAGGLAGGISAGAFARKLSLSKAGNLLIACAVCVFPISAALAFLKSGMANYIILTGCCFLVMFFSTIFTVQMLSFFQSVIPADLAGKVIALILTVSMCAQPLGSALYGVLFEIWEGSEYVVVMFSGILSSAVAVGARKAFASNT